MEQSDLLPYVVAVLERLGVRYLITGSMASIAYGEARPTHDIDLVVELPPSRVDEFCRSFPSPEFYISEQAAR